MQIDLRSGWRGSQRTTVYDVDLDRKGVRRQVVGHDRIRYFVLLAGSVDDRWRHDYRAVQLDSTDLFRFKLDLESPTICFEGSSGEGNLMLLLDRLENLVARVNRRAPSPEPTLRRPA